LEFYNGERPHQALDYGTPDRVYATGQGGGALIVDKFGDDGGNRFRYALPGESCALRGAGTAAALL